MKGLIFNIEEFAVHDGPGIRKLVFFKGCPLHCMWCHNPEGISFKKEMMVSDSACISCERCTAACKNDKCISCGVCVDICPLRLRKLTGEEFEAGALAAKLLLGKEVLIKSGGGITISGGEPLAQPAFFFELISKLKPLNIAIETSGHASKHVFRRMVHEVDLVLMDVKHTDPVIHKKYTGVDNKQILNNLELLCGSETDFCIRVPLIPGVNDTRDNMEKTASLVKGAKHLKSIELLPYHLTAGTKYRMLDKEYKPDFDTTGKVQVHEDIFRRHGLNVKVL